MIEKKPLAVPQKPAPSQYDDSLLGLDLGLPFLGIPYFGEIQPVISDEVTEDAKSENVQKPLLSVSAESIAEDNKVNDYKSSAQQDALSLKSDGNAQLYESGVTKTVDYGKDELILASRNPFSESDDASGDLILGQTVEVAEARIPTIEKHLLPEKHFSPTLGGALIETKSGSQSEGHEMSAESERINMLEKQLSAEKDLTTSLEEALIDREARGIKLQNKLAEAEPERVHKLEKDLHAERQLTATLEEALIELEACNFNSKCELYKAKAERVHKLEKDLIAGRQRIAVLEEALINVDPQRKARRVVSDADERKDAKNYTSDENIHAPMTQDGSACFAIGNDSYESKTTKSHNLHESVNALTTPLETESSFTDRLKIPSQLGSDMSDLYAAIERSLKIASEQDDSDVVEQTQIKKLEAKTLDSGRLSVSSSSSLQEDIPNIGHAHDNFQASDLLAKPSTYVSSVFSTSEEGLGISLLAAHSVISSGSSSDKVLLPDLQAKCGELVPVEVTHKATVIEPDEEESTTELKEDTKNGEEISESDKYEPQAVISAVKAADSERALGGRLDNACNGLHVSLIENETLATTQYPPPLPLRPRPPEPQEDLINRRAQQTQDAISYISSLGVKIGNNPYIDRDGSTCSSADTSANTHEKKTVSTAASSPLPKDLSLAVSAPQSLKSPLPTDTSTIDTSTIDISSPSSSQSPPFSEITSIASSPPMSIQGQVYSEIQKLQILEDEKNKKGGSKSAKDAITKSIEVIQRTYLSDAPARTRSAQRIHHMPSLSLLSLGGSNKTSVGKAIGDAASTGNAQVLLELLTNHPKLIDLRTSNGGSDHPKTALMRAALSGHIKCMAVLHIRGADLSAVDRRGRTALHLAVAANQEASVKWLLRSSVNVDTVKTRSGTLDLKEISDIDGSKPLHVAAKRNHSGLVDTLVTAGANVESVDHFGRTPLHIAVMNGHLGTCILLVEKVAFINALDGDQMTPLHWASKVGHLAILDFLLLKGADCGVFDSNGYLPLHHAVVSGQPEALEKLCRQKQDLEVRTKSGEMPIHLACLKSRLPVIDFLLRNGVEVNPWTTPPTARPGTRGLFSRSLRRESSSPSLPAVPSTPLHLACQAGHYAGTNLLLKNGAWVNAPQEEGKTPLMLAVETGNTQLVSLIIGNGATINAKTSGLCETALHISCRRADLETSRILVQHGADIFARTSGSLPEKPLDYALKIPVKEVSLEKRNAIIEYVTLAGIQKSMARHVNSRMGLPISGVAQTAALVNPWSQVPGGRQPLPQLPQSSPFNLQQFHQYFDPATAPQCAVAPSSTPTSGLPSRYRLG